MRIEKRIVFNTKHDESAGKKAFEIMNKKYPGMKDTGSFIVKLFEDDPKYKLLIQYLEENNFSKFITDDEVFSKEEMLSAPIMQMKPDSYTESRPMPKKDYGYLKESYDQNSGCNICTKGKIQNKPLQLIEKTSLGKKDIIGMRWTYGFLVSKRFKELAEEAELTGCEFWPIIKYKEKEPFDGIFQLKITGVMPKMASETNIIHDFSVCNICGHEKVYPKGRIYYNASDLRNIPDFALTQEWFGMYWDIWQWPFMSQRAYRFFKENKISGMRFYPPEILDK